MERNESEDRFNYGVEFENKACTSFFGWLSVLLVISWYV